MNDELYERYLNMGERVIYEEKKASWEALLSARRANLVHDEVIKYVISVMNSLNGVVSPADLQSVVDYFPYKPPYEELSKESMENIRRMVLTYAKHGPEFFEATQIGEMDEQLKKYVEKIKEDNKKYQEKENAKFKEKDEHKLSAEELMKRCEELIYPERMEEWKKNISRRMKSPTKGKEILPAIDIMCALEDGKSMKEVIALFNSYNLSRKDALPVQFMIFDFSKRGPEFYEAINHDNMNAQIRQFIAKKRKENEDLAKLHEDTKAPSVEPKEDPQTVPSKQDAEVTPVSTQEEPAQMVQEEKQEESSKETQEAPAAPQEEAPREKEEVPLTEHEKDLAVALYKSLQSRRTFEELIRSLPLSDRSILNEHLEKFASLGSALLQEQAEKQTKNASTQEEKEPEPSTPQEEPKTQETEPVEEAAPSENTAQSQEKPAIVEEPTVEPEVDPVESQEEVPAKEESAIASQSATSTMDLPPEEKRFLESVERFNALQNHDRLKAQINSIVDAMAQEDTPVDDKESHIGR